jgi:hypothetical protein
MGTIWVQFYWWSSEVLIFTGVLYGGASRDRTDDLIVANDALSQLSYSPTGRLDRWFADFISVLFPAPKAATHRRKVT